MSGDVTTAAWIVNGDVVHKRLRPTPHALRYRVFSLLLDLDRLDDAAAACRLFSRNRANALSFHDRDHLSAATTNDLAGEARAMFANAGFETTDARILLSAYPRVLGFTFNPLSVFLLVAPDGTLRAAIYDVSNTFRERKSYVIAAGRASDSGVYAQRFDKELFVSPFAASEGRYDARIDLAHDHLTVGVMFRDANGPLIKTHFRGVSQPLTTRSAAAAVARLPMLTGKVVAGIHWEALKLWTKGVPLVRRHRSAAYSVTNVADATRLVKADHVRP